MTTTGVTIDHRIMGGVPCIAGTRIPVTTVISLLGQGQMLDAILADYPTLTRDSILAALPSTVVQAQVRSREGAHIAWPPAPSRLS
jgi:uncharacterized protein (DUF433 family)